jgi:hypothetical protein
MPPWGKRHAAPSRGTLPEPPIGVVADTQRVEVRGCDLFEFEGDKIVRKDSYWKLVAG